MPPPHKPRPLLYGLFDPEAPLVHILERLQSAGVSPQSIHVMTAIPRPEALTGTRFGTTTIGPLVFITILAGLVGIGVGLFFAGGTAAMYPIMTGGKPIVAAPIVGVISYETMMLVAIVTTFVAMLIRILSEAQSPLTKDPRIDDGMVAVAVQLNAGVPEETVVVKLLRDSGATMIERR
jgi:hypothetical protein